MHKNTNQKADITLPYDNTCPVIYDNDDHRDVYTDEYLMALASAGDIKLKGIITSYPYNRDEYEEFCRGRVEIVAKACRSGMRNIPHAVNGPGSSLVKPESGKIEDTRPIDTEGSSLICEQARLASPEKPLVVIMGGPLTAAADAYLLDNTIADNIVVAALCGTDKDMHGWNCELDRWACYIVLEKLKLVQFPEKNSIEYSPYVPKSKLTELPDNELRRWMIEKHHPVNGGPCDHDCDGPPAIPLMRRDYCLEIKKVAFKSFDDGIPVFCEVPSSKAMVVTKVDKAAATEEFFRALKNPLAY